jgi:uncharacterized protein with FMN-binding domain
MKKIKQIIGILAAIAVILSLRGWMIQRENTPLEDQFASEIQAFESAYGKGKAAETDDRVIRVVDLGHEGTRFLAAGAGYEDWILLDLLIVDGQVAEVNLVYSIESDGYGSYVEEDWFLNRLKLATVPDLELVKYRREADHEVVAITGATQTSQGAVDAVNACIQWQVQ